MKKILIMLYFVGFFGISYSQNFHPFIGSLSDSVLQENISTNLKQFEQLGIKMPGTDALNNTLFWLENKFQSFGYSQLERDTFVYNSDSLYNLIVTKTGSRFPNQYIVLCGHYDTYVGKGTNDNGSGISIILETARILKNIDLHYSVRFICFSAEESGLVGSTYYVQEHSTDSIKLVFNIDEVGGRAGMTNNTVICERDESSPTQNNAASWAITDTLATLTELYSNLNTTISYAYGSDYVPFQQAGFVITGFYEANHSPYVHTLQDLFINLDSVYVYEIAKAATAAMLYFSRFTDHTQIEYIFDDMDFGIFPNPCSSVCILKLPKYNIIRNVFIYDSFGNIIFKNIGCDSNVKIDCNQWQKGMYHVLITDGFNRKNKILKLLVL